MTRNYFSALIFGASALFCSNAALAQDVNSSDPNELIYTLATLGCADENKGFVETRLTEIGPEAEVALHMAVDKGLSEAHRALREAQAAEYYNERFGDADVRSKYTSDQLNRMHANSQAEYVEHRTDRFEQKYQRRAAAALENLQYAKDNQLGFWATHVAETAEATQPQAQAAATETVLSNPTAPVDAETAFLAEFNNGIMMTAFPNPFRDATTIQFSTTESVRVNAAVYDMTGKQVAVLYNGEVNAGQVYNQHFDADRLGNGIYLFRLATPYGVHTKRLVLSR